jgi:hypothetical protein
MSQKKVYKLVERFKGRWKSAEVKEWITQHIWDNKRISTDETASEMTKNGKDTSETFYSDEIRKVVDH